MSVIGDSRRAIADETWKLDRAEIVRLIWGDAKEASEISPWEASSRILAAGYGRFRRNGVAVSAS